MIYIWNKARYFIPSRFQKHGVIPIYPGFLNLSHSRFPSGSNLSGFRFLSSFLSTGLSKPRQSTIFPSTIYMERKYLKVAQPAVVLKCHGAEERSK